MRTCIVVGVLTAFGACASSSLAAAIPGGLTPDIPTGAPLPKPSRVAGRADLDWQGGPVLHSNRTHVIFWNPPNCSFNGGACSYKSKYQSLVTGFLANVAADSHRASNVFALTGQYFDNAGHAFYDSTYAGAVDDSDDAPANGCTLPTTAPVGWGTCLTDAQISHELSGFISSHGLPDDPADLYFLVTPEGFGSCFGTGPWECSLGGEGNFGYCGYHSYFGAFDSSQPGLYANVPYNDEPGHCQSGSPHPNDSSADPALSTLSHEQSEAITDPFPAGAGSSQTGWVDSNPESPTYQEEIGDLCEGTYGSPLGSTKSGAYNQAIGTGRYLLQEEWSNEVGGCAPRDEADSVKATVPGSGIAGVSMPLTGGGTDPDGSITHYVWIFGDGSLGSGRSIHHAFWRSGAYTVTFLIQDVTGQQASVSRVIHVSPASITRISSTGGTFKRKLLVSTDGPGTVRIAGARDALSRSGTASFTITLRGKARSEVSRPGVQKVTVTVKIMFVSVGGGAQTRTASVTFRG